MSQSSITDGISGDNTNYYGIYGSGEGSPVRYGIFGMNIFVE